ncbi:MAG: bifunctional DNA-formamidopyrimidine glycosylase/DNA-(apurinic or apyrimidinic site) lyase [Gemmatimonadota bacterium]
MPELPEAETLVRGLRPAIQGAKIAGVRIPHPDVLRAPPRSFGAAVRGRTITEVGRRGKNVLLLLDGDRILVVNLGMTGTLLPLLRRKPGAGGAAPDLADPRPTHPAVVFQLDGNLDLVFDDTRRFGSVECLSRAAWEERSSRMGPEPLDPDLTGADFHARLARSRAPLRSWLLDQKRIAGVGNIYANEALFLSRLHPRRRARSADPQEAALLLTSLRKVLREAIHRGGTTIRDYRNALGEPGGFARHLRVYGREGLPCSSCTTPVERISFGGRSAFFCPACQPMPSVRGEGT